MSTIKEGTPAVILAGGTLKGTDRPKALIRVGERLVAFAAAQAANCCPSIGPITLVADRAYVPTQLAALVERVVKPGGGIIASAIRGARGLPDDEPVLFVCGDQPLIDASMLDHFVCECRRFPSAAAWIAYVAEEAAERVLPDFGHTYAHVGGRKYC